MNKPARLYKYEAITTQTLENIKTQILYFGSPRNFNDPYDCALSPSFAQLSDDEIEMLRKINLNRSKNNIPISTQFSMLSTSELRDLFSKIGQNVINEKIMEVADQSGISCFSETNNNLLMWSHYGGNGRGVCLEFDTLFEPFNNPIYVKYQIDMPSINIYPMLSRENFDQIIDLFRIKSIDWQYEKEWRVLHKVVGTKFRYESKALTGVYFGPDINPSILEIICLILKGQNEHVKFWRGVRSTKTFSVEFSPFTYTSNIDARKAGLL